LNEDLLAPLQFEEARAPNEHTGITIVEEATVVPADGDDLADVLERPDRSNSHSVYSAIFLYHFMRAIRAALK
jgi:hypothetical protein